MDIHRQITIVALLAAALPAIAHQGSRPGMAPPAADATPAQRGDWMAQMDTQMKAMRDLHDQFDRAKTPQARADLMAEQSRLMHDGMSMMGGMGQGRMGGAMGMHGAAANAADTRLQMMDGRMEMMQHMMQMMIDRGMPMDERMAPAPVTK